MSKASSLLSGDDTRLERNPTGTSSRAHADGPDRGWMVSSTVDEGFTQAWDTVGAGANKPMSERAHLRGALCSDCEVES